MIIIYNDIHNNFSHPCPSPTRTLYFRTLKSGPNAAILQFSEIREFLRKKTDSSSDVPFHLYYRGTEAGILDQHKTDISRTDRVRRELHSNKNWQISPQGVCGRGTFKKLLKMTPAWLSISVKNSSKYVVFFWEDEWKLLFAWACQNFVLVQNSERDFIGPL